MANDLLDFQKIISVIEEHRLKAYRNINEEHVAMCSEIGQILSIKLKTKQWGDKTIEILSDYIRSKNPTLKGFTKHGLYRMVKYYNEYCNNIIVATLSQQISWSNNVMILERCKTIEEKEFYIRMCIKNNYSARELNRQIRSNYFERYMLSGGKCLQSPTRTIDEDDIPNTRILDRLSLEFLDLPNNYTEKDLRKAIISNLKYFILEIGKDFCFIGEEYRVVIGGQDFYIDLLFYNRAYSCLVAFELKLGEFIPEYSSKMDFYLEALNRFEKKENENLSVGIILCSSKNDAVVEFSIARSPSLKFVSTYTTNLIDIKALRTKIIEYRCMFEKDNSKNNVVQKEVKDKA